MGNIFSDHTEVMPPRQSTAKRKKMTAQITETPTLPRIRYFDKDAISEHLYCPICQEVFNYPIALQCGHVFCQSCITQWLRPPQNTCPECRNRVNMAYSHKGTGVDFPICHNIRRFDSPQIFGLSAGLLLLFRLRMDRTHGRTSKSCQ